MKVVTKKVTRRILKMLLLIILLSITICAVIFGPKHIKYSKWAHDVIEDSTDQTFRIASTTNIYSSDNKVIAKLSNSGSICYLEYDDIPKDCVNAFVAVEDQNFWDNIGIDIKGITRVFIRYIASNGEEAHGASTITQQLMRNIFLSREVTIERKEKEILLALSATHKYSKEDIMEFYINNICFANAYYGIEAAAEGYFGKAANECSLSQIAYLCAIPNSPEYYNPYKYPTRAISRRNKILEDMLDQGYISESQYVKAKLEEISIIDKPSNSSNSSYQSTYAIHCATEYLMKSEYGFEFRYAFTDMDDYEAYQKNYDEVYSNAKNLLYTNSYKIYTTLDSEVQENLQDKLDEGLSFNDEANENGQYLLQGAITAIDNDTGKVIAVVGGRTNEDGTRSYLNRAYQSYRQPGSTFKPLIVYTPALIQTYEPEDSVTNVSVSYAKRRSLKTVASMGGGRMSLRTALEKSKNGVAYRLYAELGTDYVMSFIEDLHFSHICPDDYTISSSLGGLTYGVSTVEMANAYNTLVNEGEYHKATCINSIIDSEGMEIYEDYGTHRVYSKEACDKMIDMMKGVLTKGTAKKLNWYKYTDNVAACKTGTTNDSKDGWLCGFTPQYTVSVWVGYDEPKTLSSLYGATYPGEIWRESMLSLIEDEYVIKNFTYSSGYDPDAKKKQNTNTQPAPVVPETPTITVDPNTGLPIVVDPNTPNIQVIDPNQQQQDTTPQPAPEPNIQVIDPNQQPQVDPNTPAVPDANPQPVDPNAVPPAE